MASLEPGDTLAVWKLDRLGRKAGHLYNLVDSLTARNITFVSLMESMDSSTIMGRALFGLIAVFAQMEKETIQMRVKAGLDAARAKGKKLGPKFKVTEYQISEVVRMAECGTSQKDIAATTGISQPTVSRILGRSAAE